METDWPVGFQFQVKVIHSHKRGCCNGRFCAGASGRNTSRLPCGLTATATRISPNRQRRFAPGARIDPTFTRMLTRMMAQVAKTLRACHGLTTITTQISPNRPILKMAVRPGGANRPYMQEDVDEDGGASCENTARLPRIDNNSHTNLPESPNIANGNSPRGRESPLRSRGC